MRLSVYHLPTTTSPGYGVICCPCLPTRIGTMR
jgi:hypothetical protein